MQVVSLIFFIRIKILNKTFSRKLTNFLFVVLQKLEKQVRKEVKVKENKYVFMDRKNFCLGQP